MSDQLLGTPETSLVKSAAETEARTFDLGSKRFVEVDLSARDDAIKAAFDAWLSQERTKAGAPISHGGIDKARLENWQEKRYLLCKDAHLWWLAVQQGKRGGKTRCAELARLQLVHGKWVLPNDEDGEKQAALEGQIKTYFTEQWALALLSATW